jgi:hypothetical protein
MPSDAVRDRNSLGLLPGTPERASLFENSDVIDATRILLGSNARIVNGSTYVKKPPKLCTGVEKVMDIGPPLSETTFIPDFGGNSNSSREIPAVRTMAFEKVKPGI